MKISFNQTHSPHVRDTNGYGYAAKMCKESLIRLGHEISWRDSTADIEINFIQPDHWHWSGPYRIAYLPWESTGLPDGWVQALNSVDEVWTPSHIIAQWLQDAGVKKNITVYEHGVDPAWSFVERDTSKRFHILHDGAEMLRKGGQEAVDSFVQTLWDEPATLTMKMVLNNFSVHDTEHLKIIKNKIPFADLVSLYQNTDLYCYPTYGEGFGLTPIQAMATGAPVLVTKGTLPYEHLIPEWSLIDSRFCDSPWPEHHPGRMLKPDFDDLCEKLRWHFDNRQLAIDTFATIAPQVTEHYNWDKLTAQAFKKFA